MPRILHTLVPLSAAAMTLALASSASADERRFAYTEEVITAPKGEVELENSVTWKHRGSAKRGYDVWNFHHELEFGVTDRFQVSLVLADWKYVDPENRGRYKSSGVEVIYNLSNPVTDFLGSGVYLEVQAGPESLELEGKLLLQKNFGPVTVAYNVGLDAEWEGEKFGNFDERTGEFSQSLGVSYDVSKNFSVGAEVLHEVEFPEWEDANDSVVWAGPNITFRFGEAYATLTGLFQLTNDRKEPDVQPRIVVGFDF